MNGQGQAELRRLAYLEAMGVDTFVSRKPLPGAATTLRLAVRSASPALSPARPSQGSPQHADVYPESSAPPARARRAPEPPDRAPGPDRASKPPDRAPGPDRASKPPNQPSEPDLASQPDRPEQASPPQDMLAFSVAATLVGGWYWLDEIPAGRSAGQDHLHLLQAICMALGLPADSPVQEHFNWPLGTGGRLEQGVDAARAAFSGFVNGRLERMKPARILVLGEWDAQWFKPDLLPEGAEKITVSAWEMLRQPQLKRQAWRELKMLK